MSGLLGMVRRLSLNNNKSCNREGKKEESHSNKTGYNTTDEKVKNYLQNLTLSAEVVTVNVPPYFS